MPAIPSNLQPALYYECLPDECVLCTLCPHDCKIASDRRGACGQEEGAENTICPACGTVVIRRWRSAVVENRLQAGRCPDCSRFVMGRWAIGG